MRRNLAAGACSGGSRETASGFLDCCGVFRRDPHRRGRYGGYGGQLLIRDASVFDAGTRVAGSVQRGGTGRACNRVAGPWWAMPTLLGSAHPTRVRSRVPPGREGTRGAVNPALETLGYLRVPLRDQRFVARRAQRGLCGVSWVNVSRYSWYAYTRSRLRPVVSRRMRACSRAAIAFAAVGFVVLSNSMTRASVTIG